MSKNSDARAKILDRDLAQPLARERRPGTDADTGHVQRCGLIDDALVEQCIGFEDHHRRPVASDRIAERRTVDLDEEYPRVAPSPTIDAGRSGRSSSSSRRLDASAGPPTTSTRSRASSRVLPVCDSFEHRTVHGTTSTAEPKMTYRGRRAVPSTNCIRDTPRAPTTAAPIAGPITDLRSRYESGRPRPYSAMPSTRQYAIAHPNLDVWTKS